MFAAGASVVETDQGEDMYVYEWYTGGLSGRKARV